MRKSVIAILLILVTLFAGGVFYLDNRQQSKSGYKEGLKIGYLHGFNDVTSGKALDPEAIKTLLSLDGESAYNKAFLRAATEGYHKGYSAGKETTL